MRVPRPLGRRPQEALPIGVLLIHSRGNDIAPRGSVGRRVAIPESARVVHLSDHALRDPLLGRLVKHGAAVLRPDLADLAGFLPCLDNVPTFLDGVRQRLFGVHVLAGFESGDGHVVMQVLGRHDVDGVDALVGQQIAIVLVGSGLVSPGLLDVGDAAVNVVLAGVADGRELNLVGRGIVQPADAVVAARAHADPPDINFFVGAAR